MNEEQQAEADAINDICQEINPEIMCESTILDDQILEDLEGEYL